MNGGLFMAYRIDYGPFIPPILGSMFRAGGDREIVGWEAPDVIVLKDQTQCRIAEDISLEELQTLKWVQLRGEEFKAFSEAELALEKLKIQQTREVYEQQQREQIEQQQKLETEKNQAFWEQYKIPFQYSVQKKQVLSGLTSNSAGDGNRTSSVWHLYVDEAYQSGRLKRCQDFLCTSGAWMETEIEWEDSEVLPRVTCRKCLRMMERFKQQ